MMPTSDGFISPRAPSLAALLKQIRYDLTFYGGTSLKSAFAVLLFDARFRLVCSYRIARYLYLRGNRQIWLHRVLAYRQLTGGGNELSPRAQLGSRIVLPHPIGIVIGGGVVIEDDVTIYQHVTLGSHGKPGQEKRYPLIMSGAKLFAGAKVIGGVRVGRRAVVGANSVVTSDVPDESIAVGMPARVVAR